MAHRNGSVLYVGNAFGRGEDEFGVTMHQPEFAKLLNDGFRHRHESIFVTFASTDMNAEVVGIDIADLKVQRLRKTQAHRVGAKKKGAVAHGACGLKNQMNFSYTKDIGNGMDSGRFD